MAVDINDVDAYQKELKDDYIINQELSKLSGSAALKCGRFLAVFIAALIATKHIGINAHAASGDPKVWDGQPVPWWTPPQSPGRERS